MTTRLTDRFASWDPLICAESFDDSDEDVENLPSAPPVHSPSPEQTADRVTVFAGSQFAKRVRRTEPEQPPVTESPEDPDGDKENQRNEQTQTLDPVRIVLGSPSPFAVSLGEENENSGNQENGPPAQSFARPGSPLRESPAKRTRPAVEARYVFGELFSAWETGDTSEQKAPLTPPRLLTPARVTTSPKRERPTDSDLSMLDEIDAMLSIKKTKAPPVAELPPAAQRSLPISPAKLPVSLRFKMLRPSSQNEMGTQMQMGAPLCDVVRHRAFLAKASQRYGAEYAYDLDKQDGAKESLKDLYGKRAQQYYQQSVQATKALGVSIQALAGYIPCASTPPFAPSRCIQWQGRSQTETSGLG